MMIKKLLFFLAVLLSIPAYATEYIQPPDSQRGGARSPGVITSGGKTIWLSGHTGDRDSTGKSLAGDFDAQFRETFRRIDLTLKKAGGSVDNLVSLTFYLTDPKNLVSAQKLRLEVFKEGRFPATTLVFVSGLPLPEQLIYVSGVAVME